MGFVNGEVTQKQRVKNRKDRSIGANAEGKGEDSYDGETRIAPQLPQTVAQILKHRFEPLPAPHIACDFFHQSCISEFASGVGLSFSAVFPSLDPLANGHCQMGANFVIKLSLAPFPTTKPTEEFHAFTLYSLLSAALGLALLSADGMQYDRRERRS
jgi:hypothetical protein